MKPRIRQSAQPHSQQNEETFDQSQVMLQRHLRSASSQASEKGWNELQRDYLVRLIGCRDAMRAEDRQQQDLFLDAGLEELAPDDHPSRPIWAMVSGR